jgi:hypothetical protein
MLVPHEEVLHMKIDIHPVRHKGRRGSIPITMVAKVPERTSVGEAARLRITDAARSPMPY